MIIAQGLAAFVLWLGYGFWLKRSSEKMRRHYSAMNRTKRTVLGPLLLLVSFAIMFGTLILLENLKLMRADGFTLIGWLMVFVAGLAFVHVQVMGAAMMITLAQREETRVGRPTSIQGSEEVSP